MIRALLLGTVAALAAHSAAAQEGGPIRTGEHSGYTRVVMVIAPSTEWSLETSNGRASLFFPGRQVSFGTQGVFDRIPRTRVTAIKSEITPRGTRVDVAVNCDCRISASFVGARHLALDVADRDAAGAAPAPQPAAAPPAEPEPALDAAAAPPAEDAPDAREAREETVVATAENVLLQQLSRAADQGLIQLAPDETLPEATPPDPSAQTVEAIDGAETPEEETFETPDGATLEQGLAELMLQEQIEAMTVFDRDNAALAAQRAKERAKTPDPCVPDDALDVGRWTNGLSLHAQTPELMGGVVGEFDKPDPRALRDLSRLYIRFGFGAEAEGMLDDFGAEFPDRALLADLARTVEGRPVAEDGPLALDVACPGRHGLWMALGGAAPAWHDAENFATVQAAFADLPPDMRSLLGPTLIARLVDAGRPAEARLIEVTALRPGAPATVEMQFAQARLLAAEDKPLEAVAALRNLAESGAYNAVDALMEMTRIAIDENLALPERMLVDLRGAALQQRGAPYEAKLRGLLVEALAQRGALAESVAEVRAAQADIPEAHDEFAELGQAMLGSALPERVGAVAYAETVLDASDLIAPSESGDGARAAISGHLMDVGLANAALGVLGPPLSRGDAESRLLAARAHLSLGDAEAAIAALEGLEGFEALTLRATALARSGAPEEAVALLEAAGALAEAQPYAWPSGDWDLVSAGETDPERLAMAAFMAAQSGSGTEAEAPGSDELTPETAFQSALPPLDEPSLGAARDMLATAAEVGGFLSGLLSGEAEPPNP